MTLLLLHPMTIAYTPPKAIWSCDFMSTTAATPVAPLPVTAVVIVKTAIKFWHSTIILLYLGQAMIILSAPPLFYFLQQMFLGILFSGLGFFFGY